MARLDRLYALAERLRRPGGSTVSELALQLGVTGRTVQRDLARLRDQGLPIEGEPGRGGGLRPRGEASPPPLGLTLGEARRLSLGHRIGSALGALPAGATLDLLLAKLRAGLPKDSARRLGAVLARVMVGPPPSGPVLATLEPFDVQVYSACEEAFLHGFELEMEYVDRVGHSTTRFIQPHGLLVQSPLWYLLAWDLGKAEERTFRLDRIRSAAGRRNSPFEPRDLRHLIADLRNHGLDLGI